MLPLSESDQNNEDPFKNCEAIIQEVDSEESSHTRKSARSIKSSKSKKSIIQRAKTVSAAHNRSTMHEAPEKKANLNLSFVSRISRKSRASRAPAPPKPQILETSNLGETPKALN